MFGDRKAKDEEGYVEDKDYEVDTDKLSLVVQTIFRKAQQEHAYANFYAKLCSKIVRLELTMKGLQPVRANAKFGKFRTQLLDYCKKTFEKLFETPEKMGKKDEKETEEDRLDRELRYKHKLFGNMDFVGELYKEQLVSDVILYSIFECLLGLGYYSVTEITVDAALKLINKLGSKMEQDIKTKKDGKKVEAQNNQKRIFDEFQKLMDASNAKCSARIKLLIKNMFDNKNSGW